MDLGKAAALKLEFQRAFRENIYARMATIYLMMTTVTIPILINVWGKPARNNDIAGIA